MKTQNKVFLLFAWIVICLTQSCSKDQTAELRNEVNFTQNTTNIENTVFEKLGAVEVAEMMKKMQNTSRFIINYEGELLDGIVNYGDVVYNGDYDLANAAFWSFSGNANDLVSIDVNRISCEMDPVIIVYSGAGETDDLVFYALGDDEDPAACQGVCESFNDPKLEDLVLPLTGDYTIAVWDISGPGECTGGPQEYSIVMTITPGNSDADGDGCNDEDDPHPNSNQDTTVNIDGCDTGVANVFIGCSTMNDLIADCAANACNHGAFVSCVAHLTRDWKRAGLISGREKGKIVRCAARSGLPY